jgi:hypothetical protein
MGLRETAVIATAEYGAPLVAAAAKGRIYGCTVPSGKIRERRTQ